MFDMLTLDQLFDLHSEVSDAHHANYRRMIGPDHKPRISIYSDEWRVLSAKGSELWETAEAVYAVIQRRSLAETWDLAKPAMQTGLNDA